MCDHLFAMLLLATLTSLSVNAEKEEEEQGLEDCCAGCGCSLLAFDMQSINLKHYGRSSSWLRPSGSMMSTMRSKNMYLCRIICQKVICFEFVSSFTV